MPADLLASEMQRLTRTMIQADAAIAAAKATTSDVEATLASALKAASHCQSAYVSAPGHVRRLINQGFFVKLLIGEDGSVERAEMTEPFAALLTGDQTTSPKTTYDTARPYQIASGETDPPETITERATPYNVLVATYGEVTAVTERTQTNTSSKNFLSGHGLKDECLVGATGFEPATARV